MIKQITDIDPFEQERRYVLDNHSDLRRKYGTDYLALMGKEVIDHDESEIKLARRMETRFRSVPLLISTIDNILNPIEHCLPSPEAC